jgi:hypothetical protein
MSRSTPRSGSTRRGAPRLWKASRWRCWRAGCRCATSSTAASGQQAAGRHALVLKRQPPLPVATISQWWVSRSSSAVVILASPNTLGHIPNARLVVTMIEVRSYNRLTAWQGSCAPVRAKGRYSADQARQAPMEMNPQSALSTCASTPRVWHIAVPSGARGVHSISGSV